MTGKTHLTIGVASAIAIAPSHSWKDFAMCAGLGAIGGLISDIDVDSSDASDGLKKILTCVGIGAAILVFAEWQWNLGILNQITANQSRTAWLISAAIFLLLCIIGKMQPHRGFMHSLAAVLIFTLAVKGLVGDYSLAFGIGMTSHLLIDLLNRKGEQLLYPLPKRFCLKLCNADGAVNHFFGLAGLLVIAIEIILMVF